MEYDNNEWSKANTVSIYTAATKLKIKIGVIKYHIENGNIESVDEKIKLLDFEYMQNQKEQYIGIKEFIYQHDGGRFEAKYVRNRNKYIDFLEENDYFGAIIMESVAILFALTETEDFYIRREDSLYIDYKSESFFKNFGLTEKEKVQRLIKESSGRPYTVKYLKKYMEQNDSDDPIYTPSITSFVDILLSVDDVRKLTDQDIISIVDSADILSTKEIIVAFLQFVSRYENVRYHNINIKKRKSESISAYTYEEYIKLAKLLFNSDYDEKNDLTIKALENHLYAEMWLFLAVHYVCGWRASDICNNWVYLNFKTDENPFKIKTETLKEDIINGAISDKTYEDIALYTIKKIEMSSNTPSKTAQSKAGKLRSEIVPELRIFFGKLALIAECHYLLSGDGYMKSGRVCSYCNWVNCREFFGEQFFELMGRNNILSRRLNKSYLQGMEETAKINGSTALVAHIIASFARNHSNIDTTAIYLKDHGLTGESAEVVFYMMMQRGVFGVSLYTTLVAAYPEEFAKLSAKEQTKIMEMIPLSAYELETAGIALVASERMFTALLQGKTEEPTQILKAMYAIGQGKGKAKDTGIYCKKKALGECCPFTLYESCIANVCPYHVFTSDGVPVLINVIKIYMEKYYTTGNIKYKVALEKKIIPVFHDVLNAVLKDMPQQERKAIKALIEEGLHE